MKVYLTAAFAALAALAPPAGETAVAVTAGVTPARESVAPAVPAWMIGVFIGRNDKYGGRIVQLRIFPDGRVTGVADRTLVLDGHVEGDRLVFADGALRVVQTDEGLNTIEVGDENNIVTYVRQ